RETEARGPANGKHRRLSFPAPGNGNRLTAVSPRRIRDYRCCLDHRERAALLRRVGDILAADRHRGGVGSSTGGGFADCGDLKIAKRVVMFACLVASDLI